MTVIIEHNGQVIEFPDQQTAQAYFDRMNAPQPETTLGGVAGATAAGAARGAANLLDLPGAIWSGASGLAMDGVEAVFGENDFTGAMRTGLQGGVPQGAAADTLEAVTGGASNFRGDTLAENMASTAGEFLPGGLMAKAPVAAGLIPGAASEMAGQATEGVQIPDQIPLVGGMNVEPAARMAAAVTAGGLATGGKDALRGGKARRDFIKGAPSGDKLKEQAQALYQQASARGVVSQPKRTKFLHSQMRNIAKKEGFVTPEGNVVKTAPEVRAFLNSFDDYLSKSISVDDLQALRSQIQLIAESGTPKISRVGVKMLKAHDKYVDRLAPELKQANALYTRAMRGEMMDQIDDLADIRASQMTQSGHENALRTEFRALDRKVVKNKVKGLRPDQVQAVEDVARGTPASNFARNVGKAAPTGVVSAVGAGGVPFMIGNAMGSPMIGSAMAGATMGAGMLGRAAATSMQQRAAEYASAAMRSGVPMQEIQNQLGGGLLAMIATEMARNSTGQ